MRKSKWGNTVNPAQLKITTNSRGQGGGGRTLRGGVTRTILWVHQGPFGTWGGPGVETKEQQSRKTKEEEEEIVNRVSTHDLTPGHPVQGRKGRTERKGGKDGGGGKPLSPVLCFPYTTGT